MALSKAHELLRALKKRSVRPSTAFRGSLQIGDAHLPVWSWRKVCKSANVQMKAVSKAALDEEEASRNPESTVLLSRRSYVIDQPDPDTGAPCERDIKPEDRVNAYRYGRDLVPVTPMDEEELTMGVSEKCLQLLGFVPQSDVPVLLHHALRRLTTCRPRLTAVLCSVTCSCRR